ncbi:transcription initiation factor TFIID subunit 4-like [Microplitis mediator]|uniref:transcription initiation factor TFIID subunit 4-like n=1 Tax=Microplitis mediator TaxID=375433 RepID=UPI002554F0E0|nr:transcription initiation factor TFIID subunit 4-like [Microplitis mediator]XP_057333216.1 transcription initiation factor TFIID subunit 4-like [Microplitis mediator]XP_057333217.1 transcription initiation factor TFIID subunit 4-like [Microplitis mediator]
MASANSVKHALSTLSINVDESVVNTIQGAGEQVAVPRVVSIRSTVKTRLSRRTVAASVTTTTATPRTVVSSITTTTPVTTAAVATPGPAAQTPQQRQTADNTKEKCRKFLANLLELSSREPKSVERNVRTLIQELIDTKVEPEEFCDGLKRLLNASPQPGLIDFLNKSLPLLRQSLVTNELVIDGIRPPPSNQVMPPPKAHL